MINKIQPVIVVSRYSEDLSWILDYPQDFIIYNKGEIINEEKIVKKARIINTENIGGNQRDIFKFIVDNYENLPPLVAFIQAYPFDHCKKEFFDQYIQNSSFTPLEYYGKKPANSYERRTLSGGFLEINNNWYIDAQNTTYHQSCKYTSFDEFMKSYFKNYHHVNWIRFSPGSQYLVEKRQITYYKKEFWSSLLEELPKNNVTEGHIIERAFYYILKNRYKARDK